MSAMLAEASVEPASEVTRSSSLSPLELRVDELRQLWPKTVEKPECIDPLPETGVSDRTTGAYYLWSQEHDRDSLSHIETSVLSIGALERIQATLSPDEVIIGAPRYYRHVGDSITRIDLFERLAGAVWFITSDRASRIRAGHQRLSPFCRQQPNHLYVKYYVHETDLSFPFIEPEDVRTLLGIDNEMWKRACEEMSSRRIIISCCM